MEDEMIFGIRAVIEAIEAGKEIDKLLIKKDLQGDLSRELFTILKGKHKHSSHATSFNTNHQQNKHHRKAYHYLELLQIAKFG
jgi:23S rRNA (guanosine2251-2'-O)-methyltransferase